MTEPTGARRLLEGGNRLKLGLFRINCSKSNPFGISFETMAWAAGIASKTEQICPVGTLHLPMWHPAASAKQAATIDHLSGGRFIFNAVMGWFKPDMDMFGIEMREHDRRYE